MRDVHHPSAPIAPACLAPAAPPLGVIEEVHGAVIDIRCTRLPPLHQALYVCLNDERYHFEVHRHLDEQRVRAIALHRTAGLRRDGLKRGVVTLCIGGGQGIALVVESL